MVGAHDPIAVVMNVAAQYGQVMIAMIDAAERTTRDFKVLQTVMVAKQTEGLTATGSINGDGMFADAADGNRIARLAGAVEHYTVDDGRVKFDEITGQQALRQIAQAGKGLSDADSVGSHSEDGSLGEKAKSTTKVGRLEGLNGDHARQVKAPSGDVAG
jgi:hypothetical protein